MWLWLKLTSMLTSPIRRMIFTITNLKHFVFTFSIEISKWKNLLRHEKNENKPKRGREWPIFLNECAAAWLWLLINAKVSARLYQMCYHETLLVEGDEQLDQADRGTCIASWHTCTAFFWVCHKQNSGQSYKHFTLINYDSRIALTSKLPKLRL